MIVLDTNVLSEVMKPAPARSVMRWLGSQPSSRVFTTAITQAEILYGLALMPKGKRRSDLEWAIAAMFTEDFGGRVLPFDSDAAQVFSQIASARKKMGRPITHADAQVAAIARSRGAALATRNVSDFESCGVTVMNPWDS